MVKFCKAALATVLIGTVVLLSANQLLLSGWLARAQSGSEVTDTTLYFAYGSNMPSRYLTRIRGTGVISSTAAQLKDHRVQFAASGLFIEPAFANLYPEPGAVAYGVVHEIREADLQRIISSESSSYSMQLVTVTRADSGETDRAWTLVGERRSDESIPSQRYLDWMLEGAHEHKLPADYIQTLQVASGYYVPLISECAGAVVQLTAAATSVL